MTTRTNKVVDTKQQIMKPAEIKMCQRSEKSLKALSERFCQTYRVGAGILLDEASENMGVQRRRMYEILNILQSIGLVSRVKTAHYKWEGFDRMFEKLLDLKEQAENDPDHLFLESDLVSEEDSEDNKKASSKRRKAVATHLSERFIQIFITQAPGKSIVLEDMTSPLKALLGSNVNVMSRHRRLYDIANVFCSLGLIEKSVMTDTATKKKRRLFRWRGPELSRNNSSSAFLKGLPFVAQNNKRIPLTAMPTRAPPSHETNTRKRRKKNPPKAKRSACAKSKVPMRQLSPLVEPSRNTQTSSSAAADQATASSRGVESKGHGQQVKEPILTQGTRDKLKTPDQATPVAQKVHTAKPVAPVGEVESPVPILKAPLTVSVHTAPETSNGCCGKIPAAGKLECLATASCKALEMKSHGIANSAPPSESMVSFPQAEMPIERSKSTDVLTKTLLTKTLLTKTPVRTEETSAAQGEQFTPTGEDLSMKHQIDLLQQQLKGSEHREKMLLGKLRSQDNQIKRLLASRRSRLSAKRSGHNSSLNYSPFGGLVSSPYRRRYEREHSNGASRLSSNLSLPFLDETEPVCGLTPGRSASSSSTLGSAESPLTTLSSPRDLHTKLPTLPFLRSPMAMSQMIEGMSRTPIRTPGGAVRNHPRTYTMLDSPQYAYIFDTLSPIPGVYIGDEL